MELYEAITTRRTIKEFSSRPVPTEVLERALNAGLWAQNHRLTQPWRFTILGAQTHRALAASFAQAQAETLGAETSEAKREEIRANVAAKLLSKPQLVVVSNVLIGNAATRREDYAATSCAIQNIQLAAWSEGLGMQWSTGKVIELPATYDLLGIEPETEEIIGLLYFGYPANVPVGLERKPLSEVSRYLA